MCTYMRTYSRIIQNAYAPIVDTHCGILQIIDNRRKRGSQAITRRKAARQM